MCDLPVDQRGNSSGGTELRCCVRFEKGTTVVFQTNSILFFLDSCEAFSDIWHQVLSNFYKWSPVISEDSIVCPFPLRLLTLEILGWITISW